VGVAVGAGVAGGWGVGLGVLTGDEVAVGTGVPGGGGIGLGVLTGDEVAVGTGVLRGCFFNLDGAVVRRLAWAGGVAAVKKVNSNAVTPNRRSVKAQRPFILSPPEESLRRRNATPLTALFIESGFANRPEDVGSMRGMFVESKRNEEAAADNGPACQAARKEPSPQWVPSSDAINSNEVWETLSTRLLTIRHVD
jgi:hypothetical protein